MVAVLTLDLRNSKMYHKEKRNEIQQYLIRVTDHLNLLFATGLLRSLRFSGGDELQGLFRNPDSAFLCLRMFQRMLRQIPFHAGIGIGEWTTVVDERDTFYQDGPVYHRARKAIDQSKKETDYTALICSGTERDPFLNALLNSCMRFMQRNSAYQNELAVLLECRFPIQPKLPLNPNMLEKTPSIIKTAPVRSQESFTPVQVLSLAEKNHPFDYISDKKTASPLEALQKPITVLPETHSSSDNLIFRNGHPFRAASELAEYTGLKRQAVDSALRSSGTYIERSVALALVEALNEFSSETLSRKEIDQ